MPLIWSSISTSIPCACSSCSASATSSTSSKKSSSAPTPTPKPPAKLFRTASPIHQLVPATARPISQSMATPPATSTAPPPPTPIGPSSVNSSATGRHLLCPSHILANPTPPSATASTASTARLRNHPRRPASSSSPLQRTHPRPQEVAWTLDSTGAATTELNKSDRNRTHTSDALGYYIYQSLPPQTQNRPPIPRPRSIRLNPRSSVFNPCHSAFQSRTRSSVSPCQGLSSSLRMWILIAEDESSMGDLLTQGLQEQNHTVTLARDGEEALAALSVTNFDAIVLDVMMPASTVSKSPAVSAPQKTTRPSSCSPLATPRRHRHRPRCRRRRLLSQTLLPKRSTSPASVPSPAAPSSRPSKNSAQATSVSTPPPAPSHATANPSR